MRKLVLALAVLAGVAVPVAVNAAPLSAPVLQSARTYTPIPAQVRICTTHCIGGGICQTVCI